MKKNEIIKVKNYQDFIINFKGLIDKYEFEDLNKDNFIIKIPKWSINTEIIIKGNFNGYNFKGILNEISKWHEYEINSPIGVKDLYDIIIKISKKNLCANFFYELAYQTNDDFYFFIEGDEIIFKDIQWDTTTPIEIKNDFIDLFYGIERIDQLEDLEDLEDVFELIEPRDTFFNECVFELTFKEIKLKNEFKLIWKEK